MRAMNLNANAKCIAHTILIKTRLHLLNAMPRHKKNKAADQRQNYWAHRPEGSGYTNQPKAVQDSAYIKQPTYRNTHRSNANPSHTSRTPRVGEATLSGRFHDKMLQRQAVPCLSRQHHLQAAPCHNKTCHPPVEPCRNKTQKTLIKTHLPPVEAPRRNAALVPVQLNIPKVPPVGYLNRLISEPNAISAPNAPVANLQDLCATSLLLARLL